MVLDGLRGPLRRSHFRAHLGWHLSSWRGEGRPWDWLTLRNRLKWHEARLGLYAHVRLAHRLKLVHGDRLALERRRLVHNRRHVVLSVCHRHDLACGYRGQLCYRLQHCHRLKHGLESVLGIEVDEAPLDGALVDRVGVRVLRHLFLAGTGTGGDDLAVLEAGHAAQLAGEDEHEDGKDETDRYRDHYRCRVEHVVRVRVIVVVIIVVT